MTAPSGNIAGRIYFRFFREAVRPWHVRSLVRIVQQTKPDIIHSLGLNVGWRNQCGPILDAKLRLGGDFPCPWIYSSWGTDLDFYPNLSNNARKDVVAVLGGCDGYIAECDRDIRLAKEFGFKGERLGKLPAFGGMDVDALAKCRTKGLVSARRAIFLKGRDQAGNSDPVGRAMTAMKAFALHPDLLAGRRMAVGQASWAVVAEAAVLSRTFGANINVLADVLHEDLFRIVGESRVFISLTVNDGLPASLVEAMALGALPIHSDLEPIREWIRDGENGLLVPPEDPVAVAAAIRRALRDDELVDRAAEINARLVREKLSAEVIRPRVLALYQRVAAGCPMEDAGR